MMENLIGLGRPAAGPPPPRSRDDPAQAVTFVLTTTSNRWQEEARILYANATFEKAQRIVNSLLKMLVPPAIEEEKERKKREEEERKKREEERAERERQEKAAKEEAEKERKRKEEEEEAQRRQLEAERAAEEAARQASEPSPMEDVQPTEPAPPPVEETPAEGEPAQAGTSEPERRVHTTIRGRQLDITGMDIDPEYLEALPEEIREEVIMQQLAEQRSNAVAAGEEPSEINPEFLDALPPDIREELLQQEAAERRRRERENARRQAAANGTPHAEDMDPASFIATLDPTLRRTVLADQPDDILATLGPEFVTEARALSGRRLFHTDNITGRNRDDQLPRGETAKKPQRRPVVQLLDKAGVATLLRLMFMPLPTNARHHLNDILHNVCQNRQNRIEVISLLLSILQDGSADVSAVERSFAHLSLRAKTPTSQKTPQQGKRPAPLTHPGASSDVTPHMVIQQCLSALSFLTQYNPHIAWFFLTEHDTAAALKLKALRKGKSKENRANKFALNSLLTLLDRKSILDSPSCMEQLSSLLSSVTQPLTILLRKDKAKEAEESKPKETEGEQPAQPEETREDTTMTDAGAAEPGQPEQAEQTEQAEAPADESGPSKPPAEDEQKQKKPRTIEPPVVPETSLQLVVRILTARECNGRTFRETVSTLNNLSAIPGAREVFGRELIRQAKLLSQTILLDLDELIPHIQNAKTGTDVQGMALSKFSPSSSDQAKLPLITSLTRAEPRRTNPKLRVGRKRTFSRRFTRAQRLAHSGQN
jgi:E3 ubiquitin-protein ligase HUWE1